MGEGIMPSMPKVTVTIGGVQYEWKEEPVTLQKDPHEQLREIIGYYAEKYNQTEDEVIATLLQISKDLNRENTL